MSKLFERLTSIPVATTSRLVPTRRCFESARIQTLEIFARNLFPNRLKFSTRKANIIWEVSIAWLGHRVVDWLPRVRMINWWKLFDWTWIAWKTKQTVRMIEWEGIEMHWSSFLSDVEIELTHHNGTVRDVVFMHDNLKDDSILLSGGAGDCKVYVTDVKKQTPIKSYSGHQGKKSEDHSSRRLRERCCRRLTLMERSTSTNPTFVDWWDVQAMTDVRIMDFACMPIPYRWRLENVSLSQLTIHTDRSRPHLFTVRLGCMQFCLGQSRWHFTSMGHSSTGVCQRHCCTPVKYASPTAHVLFDSHSELNFVRTSF